AQQALDQFEVPRQPREGGEVIEIKRDRLCRRGAHDRLDIGEESLVRYALVVERRQQECPGKAELGRMPRQRDRGGDPGGARADHGRMERQARLAVSRHHALALLERERGRLPGGAQHVQSVAAVGEQKTRERDRARTVRLALRIHGGGNGGNHATKLVGHVHSRGRHPLTLNAASAAILTSWASLAASGTIWTDRSSPTRIGPITVAPPSSCSSLVEIEAEWNAGMISTLAGPDRRQNG